MPDWTYHPLLRPIGIRLHGEGTRALTLDRLRAISSVAPGRWLIRFLGHSGHPEQLAFDKGGSHWPSPVVLTSVIDPDGRATRAFSQFEFGAIEVAAGSDHAKPTNGTVIIERYTGDTPPTDAEVLLRCGPELLESISNRCLVEVDLATSPHQLEAMLDDRVVGFAIVGDDIDAIARWVTAARAALGETALLAAGAVQQPKDAVNLHEAGADLLLVGEGLTVSGPGVAKRIDDALIAMQAPPRIPMRPWLVGTIFGLGIIVAAVIALYLAATTVILAYDEKFVGMRREDFNDINPLLLEFMRHDRISYAGATFCLGILYTALAFFGIRKGQKWAYHSFVASGLAGFSTLFLFIGFGYFDIGNAAVHFVMWPIFLFAVLKPPQWQSVGNARDVLNDRVWRRAKTAQLLFVSTAVGLIIGGFVITVVGSINVFVVSDLHYLDTTSEAIRTANERLLPLIAHDRVTFGGAIMCDGLATLLIALWGFKRGEAWVWWSLLLAGGVNLGFTFHAHLSTGYTEFGHMFPVLVGAAFFVGGLALSRRYLLDR